ncbi:MAG: transpeptidase family protein [Flavobacteriales bacterium]|nr:transpeptidase family protein [Flavobacteriales bacterium]
MEEKKDILWRVYLVYFFMCLFGAAIVGRIVFIQFVEGDKWISKAENTTTKLKDIEAVRGNIYAEDGSLLATSIPIYEVRFDPNCDALKDVVWDENIDSLCISLSILFDDKTATEYKRDLIGAKENGARYHLIKRNVKYTQLKKMREFPIFKRGRYKGGFIFMQQNKRQKPFRQLAARTIGYDRDGLKPVGLEGAYRTELKGIEGKRLMQKIGGGVWMPLNADNEIEPQDGSDIVTTIDVNIQDVAHRALLEQLELHNADHGCVVMMEVSTGEIKAIANLSRGKDGDYYEQYNYAIGESTEPGSTFKLASVIAALEEGLVNVTDSVDTGNGRYKFYDQVMTDSKFGGHGKMTFGEALVVSSNIGISKVINDAYAKNPQAFVDRLYKMNLQQSLDVEIAGEGKPLIKSTKDKSWSGVTLPWMSIGYEVQMTPLQILTFYNAIANNGRMVQPKFVNEVQVRGKTIRKIKTQVINESICSKSTIEKIKPLLEEVVENGTARNLKNAHFKIAGKTGTVQIANDKYGYKYDSKVSHQASFVGYFPAESPKYSCIVVVNAPSNNVYYGNLVAGPIFKEIADKVYANSVEIHEELQQQELMANNTIPVSKNGSQKDLVKVFKKLAVPTDVQSLDNQWAITRTGDESVEIQVRKVITGLVPNVVGMAATDAIFLLENAGLGVKIDGKGTIKSQSIKPGLRVGIGDQITLELS